MFNFRSDGRHFDGSKRCLIVLSGLFEFTGSKSPKTKHRMGVTRLWSKIAVGTLDFAVLTTTPPS